MPEDLDEDDYADIEVITTLLRNQELTTKLRAAAKSSELYEALLNGHVAAAPEVAREA